MPTFKQRLVQVTIRFFVFSLIVSLIFSCTDSPEPGPPSTLLDKTFERLQGVGELNDVSFDPDLRKGARKSGEFFDPFIEFLRDSTFLIIDAKENGFRGKYLLKEDEIELTGFGIIEDYSLEEGKLIATIRKSGTGEVFRIESIKFTIPPIEERTEMLMGEWHLVEVLGDPRYLDQVIKLYNTKKELIAEGKLEGVLIGFTPSGVYYNMLKIKGKLYMNELLYWKWKLNSSSILIYGRKNNPPSDSSAGLLIENLTKNEFTWYEGDEPDNSGWKFRRKL